MEGITSAADSVDGSALTQAIDETFSSAGYSRQEFDEQVQTLHSIYSGSGMVWGVLIVETFEELRATWVDTDSKVSRTINTFARVAKPEERWNLTLLAVVKEQLRESYLHHVSRFQEDPRYFARFIVWLKGQNPIPEFRKDLAFLLMEWMESGSKAGEPLPSTKDDISSIVQSVGSDVGLTRLDAIQGEMAKAHPEAPKLAEAILKDSKGANKR